MPLSLFQVYINMHLAPPPPTFLRSVLSLSFYLYLKCKHFSFKDFSQGLRWLIWKFWWWWDLVYGGVIYICITLFDSMCIPTAFQGTISVKLSNWMIICLNLWYWFNPFCNEYSSIINLILYAEDKKIDFMLLYILGDCHAS